LYRRLAVCRLFPLLRRAAKIRGGSPAVPSPGGLRLNGHHKGSPTLIRQDKQMPNTALALLDTVIAVEGEIDASGWFEPSRPSGGAAPNDA
jgi:hypothetical protein